MWGGGGLVISVSPLLAGGAAETGMPKGVLSSSLSFEEDATLFPAAEWCVRGDWVAAAMLSLRRCCDDRWLKGGTVRNCPEVDMVLEGW